MHLDCPDLDMTEVEKNRLICTDIINLENKTTQNSPTTSFGRKMAPYKTFFTRIKGWIHHQALLYGHASILSVAGCDWTTVNFFASVKD